MPPLGPRPTHFLCIPLVTPISQPQLQTSLSSFRDALLTNPLLSSSIPLDAVRPLGTLHLTLGVMALPTPAAVSRALAVLSGLRPREILASLRGTRGTPTGGLALSLAGLKSMQMDVKQCSVLYAEPRDGEGVVQGFCERVRAEFVRAGVVQEDGRGLLLHATIVNTVYVPGQGRGKKKRLVMDAEEAVQLFEGQEWCVDVPVDRIAICQMGAKKVAGVKGEEYVEEGHVDV
ncbi:hypothetical protein TD95_005397 [Thielaviopsis punctulata]|uniref:A-kinase anchor protein 7-like phosphoesterase domain-containing protein n=1 Tax=Thielaviopsis punctulata TaxID=72032 RepID=A0A0F4ZF71_9PEZI|nr:hypothetical protein TD95_005397 [Thielaviopsis punctulata]